VNEICQLNPHADVRKENGIWFFNFTTDGEGDERVRKSLKNPTSHRRVPLHPRLIELDLPRYVERIRETGSRLLFPDWP
jgi:hypothetical protein